MYNHVLYIAGKNAAIVDAVTPIAVARRQAIATANLLKSVPVILTVRTQASICWLRFWVALLKISFHLESGVLPKM